jgi:hypothetical protein
MTEPEWLESKNPQPMLEYLVGRATERKFRLFAIECCRRVQKYIVDPRCIQALITLEENVQASRYDSQFEVAANNARAVWHERLYQVMASIVGDELALQAAASSMGTLTGLLDEPTASAVMAQVQRDPLHRAACAIWVAAGAGDPTDDEDFASLRAEVASAHAAIASGNAFAEEAHQAQIIRDIFGNPFRRTIITPCWLTETVVTLASGIYAERAFDELSILADVLEDSGCENPEILSHCRKESSHVRGCWIIDMVLGKE